MSESNAQARETSDPKKKSRRRRRRKGPISGAAQTRSQERPVRSRGELVGWLVSYGLDSQGLAHELRSGRSIVSSQSLGGASAVIEIQDRSVSSPHAALGSLNGQRLVIQDILSEAGTFIQRSAGGEEEQIAGPTPLRHGDWIRFGDAVRFQVCLIEQ